MSYQVLARKWRPRTFDTLVGQDHVVRALTHALREQRLHHAYLFTGTRGVGKTTLSRILAKALNCEQGITATPCGVCRACREIDAGRFVDYVEMDAASNRGVDEMAALLERAVYAPVDARFKVYMIDEVHMLTNHAFNAMLKTLEEPPPYVKFILATTDPQKIPVTVLSRCLQFNLKQMPPPEIVGHLSRVLEAEQIDFEAPALRLLARAADGSMRDALSLTDQAIAYAAGALSEEAVRGMLGTLDQGYLVRLLDALAARDGAAVLAIADEMAARSLSFSVALQDLAQWLHRIAWAQFAPASSLPDALDVTEVERFARTWPAERVQLYYQIATVGRHELALAPDEYAGFTMTLLRMLAFQPGAAPQGGAAPLAGPPGAGLSRMPAQAEPSALRAAGGAPTRATAQARVAEAVRADALHASPMRPSDDPRPSAKAAVVPPAAAADARDTAPFQTSGPAPLPPAARFDDTPPWDDAPTPEPAAAPSGDAPASKSSAQSIDRPAASPASGAAVGAEQSPASAARQVLDALRGFKGGRSTASAGGTAPPAASPRPVAAPVPQSLSAPQRVAPRREPPAAETSEPVGDMPPWEDIPFDAYYADETSPAVPRPMTAAAPRGEAREAAPAARRTAPAASSPSAAVPGAAAAAAAARAELDAARADAPTLAAIGHAQDWPTLAAQLPARGLAQQLALQSELLACEDGALSLQVPVPTLAQGGHIDKLSEALAAQLGRTVAIKVSIGPARLTAAAVEAARRAAQQADAEQAIADDPFVQALVKDFGATVVPGSVRPIS